MVVVLAITFFFTHSVRKIDKKIIILLLQSAKFFFVFVFEGILTTADDRYTNKPQRVHNVN